MKLSWCIRASPRSPAVSQINFIFRSSHRSPAERWCSAVRFTAAETETFSWKQQNHLLITRAHKMSEHPPGQQIEMLAVSVRHVQTVQSVSSHVYSQYIWADCRVCRRLPARDHRSSHQISSLFHPLPEFILSGWKNWNLMRQIFSVNWSTERKTVRQEVKTVVRDEEKWRCLILPAGAEKHHQ